MAEKPTDEEIGREVSQRASDFCAALNAAGRAGLRIDIAFSNSSVSTLTDGTVQHTGWFSKTTLKRVHHV